MEFGLSSDQQMLKESVDKFLADRASLAHARDYAANKIERDDALRGGLAELGVCGLVIDEAHGGVGLSLVDAALVSESLGYAIATAPFVASSVMAPLALMRGGTDALRQSWLPKVAAGEAVIGAAVSELAGGARERAAVQAIGGKLSGRALFAFDAPADAYLVATEAAHLYLVVAGAKGFTEVPLTTIDKTRPVRELVFDGTPAEYLPGSDDGELLEMVLDAGRVMLAADTLGAAQNMLDQAVAYAKEREQFNRKIGSFQAVKHLCAEMAAGLEPCRAMVWYAAFALDALPGEAHLHACHTKAHLAEVGKFVAKTATEVHGGMGFTDLLGLHYWFKRIGLNRQLLGSPERLREEAARAQSLVA